MAEEEDRQAGVLLAGEVGDGAQVGDDGVPAVVVGEVAVVGRVRRAAVAAVVVGVDRVAGRRERLGQAGVAGGVLGHAVGDLHDRACGGPSGSQRWVWRAVPSLAVTVVVVLCMVAVLGYRWVCRAQPATPDLTGDSNAAMPLPR